MAIDSYDIVSTLQALGMMKYWKGKHIILKKQVSVPNKLCNNLRLKKKKKVLAIHKVMYIGACTRGNPNKSQSQPY